MDIDIVIERVSFASLGDEWHDLARAGYHADYAGISELYGGATTAGDKVALMQRWGRGILAWTARDAGRLVGLLTGDLDGDRLIIYDFFVDGAYRRRGIGHALVSTALRAPGLRQAAAEVNVANFASRALFEALGFTAARTVSWYVLAVDGEVAP
jgi:ribosomal protein S18 acetylase RimI-like enzyme